MNITLENIVSKAQSIINSFFKKEVTTAVVEKETIQFKVGDIFVESWGYEQTNVDFYQVIKVNKASVVLRKIGSKSLRATGWASDEVEPFKDDFVGEQTWTKRTKQGSKYLNGIACGVLVLHDNSRSYHRSWYA